MHGNNKELLPRKNMIKFDELEKPETHWGEVVWFDRIIS